MQRREGEGVIDVVGSFGSRFSYATHSVELARALHAAGMLSGIHNLDDQILEDYHDLALVEDAAPDAAIIIAAPTEPLQSLAHAFPTAALFVCPNTDQLGREAQETIRAFDHVIVPSQFCKRTVAECMTPPEGDDYPGPEISVLPLGVHDVFFEGRRSVRDRRRRRYRRGEPFRVVHFTSDFYWPGRKGTEELLESYEDTDGWRDSMSSMGLTARDERRAHLTVHCVEAMRDTIYYRMADMSLHEPEARVASSGAPRGSLPHELFEAMAEADVVVQPARSEGYGMIALAAVTAGVPLVTTAATGERDFLADWRGWVEIETGPGDALHGEDGLAPTVTPEAITDAMHRAVVHLDALHGVAAEPESRTRAYEARWAHRMTAWVKAARELAREGRIRRENT